jgi:hypothetical protein
VDGERSLGKKNVYSGSKSNVVDQYGDYLKQFGARGTYKSSDYYSGLNMTDRFPSIHVPVGMEVDEHSTTFKLKQQDGYDAMLESYKKCVHSTCPVAKWMPNEAQEDGFVGRKAIQLLRRRPKDSPFFMQVYNV